MVKLMAFTKPGYINEEGAKSDSKTETFVSIKTEIQNWRWSGVPFYLRTGKRMETKTTQIVFTLSQMGTIFLMRTKRASRVTL